MLQSQIQQIRTRLTNIIDSFCYKLHENFLKEQHTKIYLNESKLQLWYDLLKQLIISQNHIKKNKSIETYSQSLTKQSINLSTFKLPPSIQNPINQLQSQYLLDIRSNHQIHLHQLQNKTCKTIKLKGVNINQKCTYTFVNNELIVFVGGCEQNKPNMKSKDIISFHLPTRQIVDISSLSEGVSSHSCQLIYPYLFIIGGIRSHHIITKNCYRYDLKTHQIEEIASLNYPTASFCTAFINNQYIYKVGGIGDCFGEYNLSPYIQRYNINDNIWQLINPIIDIPIPLNQQILRILSIMYVSNNNELIVYGGYNLTGQGSQVGLILSIDDDNHSILKYGNVTNLPKGGFHYGQNIVVKDKCLYAIVTTSIFPYNTQLITITQ